MRELVGRAMGEARLPEGGAATPVKATHPRPAKRPTFRDGPAAKLAETPRRKSARLSASPAGKQSEGAAAAADDDDADGDDGAAGAPLTCDEWCALNNIANPGPRMDGRFQGWVEESVRRTLGIRENATAAWEANGGGKFERKCTGFERHGAEAAKLFAKSQLHKNPNAYFYRHCRPGVAQRDGEWTDEEVQKFVQVAKEYGCGDKWGLFASHIEGRVGYQCSAAYRHVIIPRGLLRDDGFRLSRSGETFYVGDAGRREMAEKRGELAGPSTAAPSS